MHKKGLISLIIIAILVIVAIPITYTFAWYNAQQTATGTITLKNGINIGYNGLAGNGPNYDLILSGSNGNSQNGKISNLAPGETINVTQVKVWQTNKPNETNPNSSSESVFRFKLIYYYATPEEGVSEDNITYTQVQPISICPHIEENGNIEVSSLFKKSGIANDDYYYYVGNNSTVTASNLVALGDSSAKISLFSDLSITLDASTPPNYHIKIKIMFEALQKNSTAISTDWKLT